MKKALAFVIAGLLFAAPALAEKHPRPGPADERVRTVVYNPRDVVRVVAAYNFHTIIQFADYEVIEDVSAGASTSWDITLNDRKNILTIKPTEENAETNLTVVTNVPGSVAGSGTTQRVYVFSLDANGQDALSDQTWSIKFQYPGDKKELLRKRMARRTLANDAIVRPKGAASNANPSDWNFKYSFAGHRSQVPKRVLDDGEFTYIEFDKKTDIPAIFLVAEDGTESLINPVPDTKGIYVVIARVGRQFTLRNGDVVTCIFNDAFSRQPELDQGSPKRRSRADIKTASDVARRR